MYLQLCLTWTTSKTQQFCETSWISKLATSKTKQFCETSSLFEVGKTQQSCEASFKNGKLTAELTASCQCVLRFFQSICLKYCACYEKVKPGHTECCTCHAKSSFANLKIWCSKSNSSQEISALHLCRSSSNAPHLPLFLEMPQNPHVLLTSGKVQNPLHLPRKTTSEPSKVVRTCCVFSILTWKSASRHNCVHSLNIPTSKSALNMVCFYILTWKRASRHSRVRFRHLKFQKCSEAEVFCTFWLGNVLRATTACTFWAYQLPEVPWTWCVLHILTWKCASRRNGIHFFDISTSKSGPRRVFCKFWFGNVLRATTACSFSTSQLPRVLRGWSVLYILTWKCSSRHNCVHFLNISTSKGAPRLKCFVMFCTFWLGNVLRATTASTFSTSQPPKVVREGSVFCKIWLGHVLPAATACTFSTSQLPKVLRGWSVLYNLTWKCTSCYNVVQFFISHLSRWLRTRRFSEPTFRPSGATNQWKNTVKRDFSTFSRTCIFFLLTLSLLWFSLLLFSSLTLPVCPYCRKFDFLNFLRLLHPCLGPQNFIEMFAQLCLSAACVHSIGNQF